MRLLWLLPFFMFMLPLRTATAHEPPVVITEIRFLPVSDNEAGLTDMGAAYKGEIEHRLHFHTAQKILDLMSERDEYPLSPASPGGQAKLAWLMEKATQISAIERTGETAEAEIQSWPVVGAEINGPFLHIYQQGAKPVAAIPENLEAGSSFADLLDGIFAQQIIWRQENRTTLLYQPAKYNASVAIE